MGQLDGVRVLDLSSWRPGPYATQLLGELGADVLKVEPPGGDPMRTYPGLFAALSVNKRSIELDLKSAAGLRRAHELAADADVVVEGWRPGVARRLGVGYDDVCALNPSVVYCSISGMGQTGDLVLAPGHDLVYQAWAGVLAPDGGEPVVPAVPIADLAGGLAAAYAICAALVRRARTGDGEYVDVAMGDVLATWTGAVQPEARDIDRSVRGVPGYGTFATRDGGHVVLGVLTEDHFWRPLCDALAIPDARDLGFAARMARITELQQRIAEAIGRRDRDELVAALLAVDVPIAPVLDRNGMIELGHFLQRQVVTRDASGEAACGHPVRFTREPAARSSPPPRLDEHRSEGFRNRD